MSRLSLSSERDSLDKESNSEMEESEDNELLIVGVRKSRERARKLETLCLFTLNLSRFNENRSILSSN